MNDGCRWASPFRRAIRKVGEPVERSGPVYPKQNRGVLFLTVPQGVPMSRAAELARCDAEIAAAEAYVVEAGRFLDALLWWADWNVERWYVEREG